MTKKLSLLLLSPTRIEPKEPQSTWAHSPGANESFKNAGLSPGTDFSDVIFEDGISAVEAFLPDFLKDLSGAVRMGFKHP